MMIVERIEETLAVAEIVSEDGSVYYERIPLHRICGDVCAGDVLEKTSNDHYIIDTAATEARRNLAILRSRRLKTP